MSDTEQCKERILVGSWGRYRQCLNKPIKDGYCSQHHPEAIKARAEKREQRWEERHAQDPLNRALKRIKELEKELSDLKAKYAP